MELFVVGTLWKEPKEDYSRNDILLGICAT